jgi:hypothetical protein
MSKKLKHNFFNSKRFAESEKIVRTSVQKKTLKSWGRCYDHNFLRFLTIFGGKIAVFLKKLML